MTYCIRRLIQFLSPYTNWIHLLIIIFYSLTTLYAEYFSHIHQACCTNCFLWLARYLPVLHINDLVVSFMELNNISQSMTLMASICTPLMSITSSNISFFYVGLMSHLLYLYLASVKYLNMIRTHNESQLDLDKLSVF